MFRSHCIVLIVLILLTSGCAINVETFRDYDEPLEEIVLQGEGDAKVLVIPVRGIVSTSPHEGLVSRRPSLVQEVVSHLSRAADDPQIKAVVLQIDSPGGTVVASEILYNELMRWRERTGAKIVALQMSVAASGGYMTSLAGDAIVAHPSTITGSIGTVFISPNVAGLMDKIGVSAEVYKSGKHKDIGSPLRASTDEERRIMQGMINEMNSRFLALVTERRGLDQAALEDVADARVLTAGQALKLGLIDRVGYVHEALEEAMRLAELPEDARVVVYRRTHFAEDNLYNTATSDYQGRTPALIDLGLPALPGVGVSGFCHLWAPEFD
ncbi:signal peptide peptidase SppA [Desulfovibrio ferrophilus]|uniref:Signal peptide peptidase SppA, 36K type n=1 Tax=Desulfovibrio ferrophilus TaxID=241368 RepID=A0A2Z6AVZ7_9BACT|nr:signal peptide peptidase SppA [Desulfovibrio ferrophilus]BBD07417.1 signal peptide peptidase SppA, 36K type [Desulfovibrio ferrophilus]